MSEVGRLVPFIVFALIGLMAAVFPKVLPRLTNRYYSLIGAKTRVAEEDYEKLAVRLACFAIFVVVIAAVVRRLFFL